MKYIGILLIIAAGLGLGLTCARRLRQRVNELCRIERLLEALCDRLLYSAQPLAALWQSFATDAVLCTYPLVQDTADELCKGVDFHTSFSRAIQKTVDAGRLMPAETALLMELGASLGHSGLDQQAQLIRYCAERLKSERQVANELATVRERIYPMMGFAGGVSVALLLM